MAFQLLYSSEASPELDETEVDELIERSKESNASKGISGLLIYVNRCFLQLLEGEEDKVRDLFDRIRSDPRHSEPFVYHEQNASQKAYGSWTTGYREPTVCTLGEEMPGPKQIARDIEALGQNKPLWIRSAVKMFGNAHTEIGHLYQLAKSNG